LPKTLPGKKNLEQAKAATQRNAALFHLLIHSLRDYAIILVNATGKILSWTVAGEQIKQYREDEILGRSFTIFYPQKDIRNGKPQKLLDEAAATGHACDEGWRLRKDGSRFWARVVITSLRDKSGRLRGFGNVVSDETDRRQAVVNLRILARKLDQRVKKRTGQLAQANRELRDSLAQLRALAARLQAVREEERTSMAREIHDDLGQMLTAMNMDLVWLMQRLPSADAGLELKVRSVLKLVDDAITSVRSIASSLRPGMLDDLGLSAAIEWQTREFQVRTGIKCDLFLPARDVVLDDERSTAVFRIFQETLTNIARHACASHAIVRLIRARRQLVLEVRDNGKGFENGAAAQKKSLGFLGMKERALILGGLIEICSKPGQGTSVAVRIPLGNAKLKPELICE
jgi:two-component system sensor kinase